MNVKQLDHLNLTVESLEETVDWYGRVFGFDLVEEGVRDGHPWGILRAGDALLCAYERPGRHVPDTEERESRSQHGFNHFGLRVTDRHAWEETLEREGLETFWDSPVRYPHSTSWYVRDPSGYEIEVAAWDGDVTAF